MNSGFLSIFRCKDTKKNMKQPNFYAFFFWNDKFLAVNYFSHPLFVIPNRPKSSYRAPLNCHIDGAKRRSISHQLLIPHAFPCAGKDSLRENSSGAINRSSSQAECIDCQSSSFAPQHSSRQA